MDLFGLGKVSRHPEGLMLLTTVYDNINLSIIRGILDDAKIPFLIKERGSGSSVKIIAGYSMFGTDLFVRPGDLEAASELIAPLDEDADGISGDETGGDEE